MVPRGSNISELKRDLRAEAQQVFIGYDDSDGDHIGTNGHPGLPVLPGITTRVTHVVVFVVVEQPPQINVNNF